MNAPARYGMVVRYLHWLIALAVVAAYVLVNIGGDEGQGDSSLPSATMQGHYLAGLVVLALMLPRLLARLATTAPAIVPEPGTLVSVAARLIHLSLYAFLIVQPIVGILDVNYGGDVVGIPWFGRSLPALVGPNKGMQELMEEIHESLGNIFYAVIGLHMAAALWHHFFVRDNTLKRML